MSEVTLTIKGLTGLIKTKDLAELFGVTERQIQQLTKAGFLHKADAAVGKSGVYRMPDVVREYRLYLSEKAKGHSLPGEDSGNLEAEKIKADIAYKRAKAKKAELELAEYEGIYHRAEDVEELVGELVMTVKAALIAMPGRLAAECEGKSSVDISETIKCECYSILRQMADHSYDPNEYKRLVREREGYRELQDDEEEEGE